MQVRTVISAGAERSARPTVELTILLPCLNEAETVQRCVAKARRYLERSGVEGEVLVADNGSTDGSPELAAAAGARVIHVNQRGYGAALRGGIDSARGKFVIMGDADDSYDFVHLDGFVDALRSGAHLVMGNRFAGGIEPGAMPWLHRRIGNPVLSWLGRLFFRNEVGDFHCGLRGFDRDAMRALGLRTTGMEFASEMVVAASLRGYRITEVPTTLDMDGRSREPHLRSFRDGWRHLRFLLLYCPRWLFLYPGLLFCVLGAASTALLVATPVRIGSVGFDVGTLLYTEALVVLGYQAVLFALLSQRVAERSGFLPQPPVSARWRRITLEQGLVAGTVITLGGLIAGLASILSWKDAGFGALDGRHTVRMIVPSTLAFIVGLQTIFGSLALSITGIDTAAVESIEFEGQAG